MDLRVDYARAHSPTDGYTLFARWLVLSVTSVLAVVLGPVDFVLRQLGRVLVRFIFFGHLTLLILTAIWWPLWAMLVYGSRLWLTRTWTRPVLVVPGALLAILAYTYLMLIPDPLKQPKYVGIPREWPLTWYLWQPPMEYIENSEFFEGDEYVGDRSDPYAVD